MHTIHTHTILLGVSCTQENRNISCFFHQYVDALLYGLKRILRLLMEILMIFYGWETPCVYTLGRQDTLYSHVSCDTCCIVYTVHPNNICLNVIHFEHIQINNSPQHIHYSHTLHSTCYDNTKSFPSKSGKFVYKRLWNTIKTAQSLTNAYPQQTVSIIII